MRIHAVLLLAAALPWVGMASAMAQTAAQESVQSLESEAPVIKANSTLVFLDVTVVDQSGKPVTTPLTRDDFTITEEGKKQRLFSFESPLDHVTAAGAADDDVDGKAPVQIYVLDQLNQHMEDFERGRQALLARFAALPETLEAPAEVMLLGNNSLEVLQGFTRSRDDLAFAVKHIQPAIPYKLGTSDVNARTDFNGERSVQSIRALVEIAVQNTGVPGRKNIFWIGPGGPNLSRAAYGTALDQWKPFVHSTIDLMVDSRISLFVIFPSLKTDNSSLALGSVDADDRSSNIGNNNLGTGDINFALFAKQTGGALFYNRNDAEAEIGESQQLGSHYFTLTYQPTDHRIDGKYRKIHVEVRKPGLRAITKDGYFALDQNRALDPQEKTVTNITGAARSSLPFTALSLRVSDVVRHSEGHSAQFTVHIKPKNLGWIQGPDGKQTASLILGVTSLSGGKKILSWKFEKMNLQSASAHPDQLDEDLRVHLTARVPPKTKNIRVLLETADGGRMGTADIDSKDLMAAPDQPLAAPAPAPASR